MIIEFLKMGGYGLYVWSSFLIVFTFCTFLFYKTRKTLKKYEKEFLHELRNLSEQEKRKVLQKSKILNQISTTNREVI